MADIQTLTADGNGNEYTVHGNSGVWVHWSGNYGSGTAKLQFKDHGGTFRDVAGGSDTIATDDIYELPHGTIIRTNLNGSSGAALIVDYRSVTLRF